jgi:hypothetical protein
MERYQESLNKILEVSDKLCYDLRGTMIFYNRVTCRIKPFVKGTFLFIIDNTQM